MLQLPAKPRIREPPRVPVPATSPTGASELSLLGSQQTSERTRCASLPPLLLPVL
jgi:hypothetical protein